MGRDTEVKVEEVKDGEDEYRKSITERRKKEGENEWTSWVGLF